MIKVCLTSEAYIDSVLVQKVLKFNFPAQQSLHIPAGQRKSFPHFFFLGLAAIFSHKGDDGFRNARGWAAPVEREEVELSRGRVSS
jgi:hypothetical protein